MSLKGAGGVGVSSCDGNAIESGSEVELCVSYRRGGRGRESVSDDESSRRRRHPPPDSDEDNYGDESFLGAILSKNDPGKVREKKIKKRLARAAATQIQTEEKEVKATRKVSPVFAIPPRRTHGSMSLDVDAQDQENRLGPSESSTSNRRNSGRGKSRARAMASKVPGSGAPVGNNTVLPENNSAKVEITPRHLYLSGLNVAIFPYVNSNENLATIMGDSKKEPLPVVSAPAQITVPPKPKIVKKPAQRSVVSVVKVSNSTSTSGHEKSVPSKVKTLKCPRSVSDARAMEYMQSLTVLQQKLENRPKRKLKLISPGFPLITQQDHEDRILSDLRATVPHYQLPRRRDIFPF